VRTQRDVSVGVLLWISQVQPGRDLSRTRGDDIDVIHPRCKPLNCIRRDEMNSNGFMMSGEDW